jgi:hypothetical protein
MFVKLNNVKGKLSHRRSSFRPKSVLKVLKHEPEIKLSELDVRSEIAVSIFLI